MASAGKWSLTHWDGGHPVWCQLYYDGAEILGGINHRELRDLHYAIGRAILECRDALPATHKHEMD